MATYIALIKWTEQGIKAVKESPKRADAARELARQRGGDLKTLYMVMGDYDLVGILEAPDDETYARVVLALGATGNIRTTTLKAFTEEEYRRIVASLP